MDKGLITIETQARLRAGDGSALSSSAATAAVTAASPHLLPPSVSQGQITTFFLHEQQQQQQTDKQQNQAAAGAQDLFTSKQAFMAEVCKKVAEEGFEPIQSVFSLPSW